MYPRSKSARLESLEIFHSPSHSASFKLLEEEEEGSVVGLELNRNSFIFSSSADVLLVFFAVQLLSQLA